jgi:penicillin-binding protein A
MRGLNIFLTVFALLLAALYGLLELPLRTARAAWLEGQPAAALDELNSWKRLRLRPADFDDGVALSLLALGRTKEAEPVIERIEKRPPVFRPFVTKVDAARALVSRGHYEGFLAYDSAAKRHVESDELDLYRSAALLGAQRPDEARRLFESVDRDDVDDKKYDALRRSIDERGRGVFTLMVDRDGKAIAQVATATDDVVAINAGFAPLIEREAGPHTIESQIAKIGTASTIETTLDARIQQSAIAALERERGAIVVIDLERNEIVAIASSSPSNRENIAIDTQFESGSIIKVLTTLAALQSGPKPASLFPMNCAGVIEIEKRQFLDWARHGSLPAFEDAMAVSCNVAFADLGTRTGRDSMLRIFDASQFGQKLPLGIVDAPLGRVRKPFYTEYELATAAIGLEHTSVNALHVAMLASALARKGEWSVPRFVRARRSILGEELRLPPHPESKRIFDPAAVAAVIPGMRAVVTSPRGTARRIELGSLQIAIKTGTAGEAVPGYDALIMGFAPVTNPRYAFGIIGQHAGPSEYAGARITEALLRGIPGLE